MDTEKCRMLLQALDCGSMAAAAEKSGYTTSGVSRMIASLEDEVGFPLLIRGRGGVSATEGCERLMPAFREMVHWSQCLSQMSADICGIETGHVTVGTSYSAYYSWFAGVIYDFCKDYPGVDISLLEGISRELYNAMENRQADFCIVSQRESDYEWIPLLDDPLVALLPENHHLAHLDAIPIKTFQNEPYIDMCSGQDTDDGRLFRRYNIKPNVQFKTTDDNAGYALIEAGLGISIANSINTKKWGGTVRVLPLEPEELVSIGIIYPSGDTLSPAARKFINFAKKWIES